MRGTQSDQPVPSADSAYMRTNGGLAPSMEIFTPTGSVPVTDLSVGDAVYTLDPELGLAKPQSVVALEQVTPNKPLVAIETPARPSISAPTNYSTIVPMLSPGHEPSLPRTSQSGQNINFSMSGSRPEGNG